MLVPKSISLLFEGQSVVPARVVDLTRRLAKKRLMGRWWDDPALDRELSDKERDRHWDWNESRIEYPAGHYLSDRKVAVVTGRLWWLSVEGAMMISTTPITFLSEPGLKCLMVEYLFTAPKNRPDVRLDKKSILTGVGTELLKWGVELSRSVGCDGRLRLDSSDEFVFWYEKRGLQNIGEPANVYWYEGKRYTPMELSARKADRLLRN